MEEVERQLNLILLEIASLEERLWGCIERLREEDRSSSDLAEYSKHHERAILLDRAVHHNL